MEWMLMPYRKLYRLIEGRSSRREYWMFTLFVVLVAIAMVALLMSVAGGIGSLMGGSGDPSALAGGGLGALMGGLGVGAILFFVVFYAWALLTGVASFAVTVRRLHDLNFSGWFIVLFYIVLVVCALISMWLYWAATIGSIVVMCLPGTKGPNKYGADPTDPTAGASAEVFA